MNVSVSIGRVIMGRLAKGEDLLSALGKHCAAAGIRLGEVRAIGAVSCARMGFYDQTERRYMFHQLDKPLEILSLMGNVSMKEGEPFVHAHVTLSDDEGRAFGGHLTEGTIVFACEFAITEYHSEESLNRGLDEETGLYLWPVQ